jgi:ABC-type lipoprotein release transport system permease subunit
MLMRMAWRNIWRNPRRSLITLSAMAFSLTLMIVATNMMEGMNRQMVGYAADRSLGHVQVHAKGYYEDKGLQDTLPLSILDRFEDGPFRAAPRAYAFGLASLGEQSAGVLIRGIDPQREREVTDLWKHMLEGHYLRPSEKKTIVLGRKIARTLNARPGSQIALITQAADGSLGNDLFRVVGVLKALDEATDRSTLIVSLDDFAELLVLPGRIHEVAVRTPNAMEAGLYKPRIASLLGGAGCEVRSWKEIAPALREALALSRAWTTIMLVIIFSIASLGILNTMLMAVFERMYELGLMMAVGLKPARMVRLILYETLMLAGVGEALGLGLGLLWSRRLAVRGWDLTGLFGEGFEYTGFAFENVLRAALWPWGMAQCMGIMILISGLAGLYPAAKAARLKPVEAMRT